MKKVIKKELKDVFEAPKPLRKKAFLRTLEQPRISMFSFVISQLGYIRRWTWTASVIIFFLSVLGAVCRPADMLWVISAMMPLLALTVVSESGRSENYEMAELEMATRFSLKSVVLARLGILGLENLVILGLLLPVQIWGQGLDVMQAAVQILTPYLMTTFTGLSIVRRFQGRESVYFCIGIAVCISFLVPAVQRSFPQLQPADTVMRGLLFCVLLCIGTARQCIGIIGRSVTA